MNRYHIFTLIVFCALSCLALAQQPDSVPKLINYQGKLTNAEGLTLQNGNYEVRFTLWDAASGGNLVWGEDRTITLIGGVFNVALGGAGSTPVIGAAVNDIRYAFGTGERYLETAILSGPGVNQEQTLAPRQQMASVPYAMNAPGVVPIGGIIMWWGALSDIPINFELCDGGVPAAGAVLTGSKPDLRGRFARGAPSGTTNVSNPAIFGGTDSLDLAHSHGAGNYVARITGPNSLSGGSESIWYDITNTGSWTSDRQIYADSTPRLVEDTDSAAATTLTTGAVVAGNSTSALGNVENRPLFSQVFYIIRVK
jgi:hypothetical protein